MGKVIIFLTLAGVETKKPPSLPDKWRGLYGVVSCSLVAFGFGVAIAHAQFFKFTGEGVAAPAK